MIITNFNKFPKKGKLVAIDWGLKRIGIAVSSECQNFTFKRNEIIEKKKQNQLKSILNFIEYEEIKGIILGLPLRITGEESDTTKKVKEFAKNLENITDLPICFIEEYLTSFEAKENIKIGNIDSESARIILENGISLIRRRT